jgi:hypothetical protein
MPPKKRKEPEELDLSGLSEESKELFTLFAVINKVRQRGRVFCRHSALKRWPSHTFAQVFVFLKQKKLPCTIDALQSTIPASLFGKFQVLLGVAPNVLRVSFETRADELHDLYGPSAMQNRRVVVFTPHTINAAACRQREQLVLEALLKRGATADSTPATALQAPAEQDLPVSPSKRRLLARAVAWEKFFTETCREPPEDTLFQPQACLEWLRGAPFFRGQVCFGGAWTVLCACSRDEKKNAAEEA